MQLTNATPASKRALGVEFGRLLAAHGQIIDQHVGTRFLENAHHVGLVGLRFVGDPERAVIRIVGHVIGDAVELAAHSDDCAARGNVIAEHLGAVRLGEDRLGYVLADLAPVNVPGGDNVDVARAVPADIPVHQPDRVVRAVAIIRQALDEGAGAVPDANDRDVDVRH